MHPSVATLIAVTVSSLALAGCLSDSTSDTDSLTGARGALATGYALHCADHDGPIINASSGQPFDVCNVAVTDGPSAVNEPSIASNPLDPCNLIAGGNDYNTDADVWVGVYHSFDCGQTWERGFLPGYPGDTSGEPSMFTPFTGAGDAAIAFDPNDGTAYYAGIAFDRAGISSGGRQTGGDASGSVGTPASLILARSDDGGQTWPMTVVPQLGTGVYGSAGTPTAPVVNFGTGAGGAAYIEFQDKEWVAVSPVDGTVYISWTRFGGVYPWVTDFDGYTPYDGVTLDFPDETPERPREETSIYVIRSDDRGETWQEEVLVSTNPDGLQGSVPIVSADGTLHIIWLEAADVSDEERDSLPERPVSILVRSSTDKGETFSDPVVLDTLGATPARGSEPHRFRTNGFPSLALDPESSSYAGRLTATWAGNQSGDSDIWMAESTDSGATWSAPVRVNQDAVGNGAHQFTPWVAVDEHGVRTFVWYDARHDPTYSTMAVYMAQTVDGASIHELEVTDAPFDVDRDGFTTANFLGDYLNVAASPEGFFAIWPDTRTARDAVGNTDLYMAHLEPV